MTDRELLELAAKAAGVEVWFPRMADGNGGVIEPCHTTRNGETQEWNPLEDDGDALRLAVKLGLTVVVESDMVFCRNRRSDKAFCERSNDPYAATRRAIVRAAAEIGRNMK